MKNCIYHRLETQALNSPPKRGNSKEPLKLTLEDWGERCGKLETELANTEQNIKDNASALKQKRETFANQILKMIQDFEAADSALDSLNAMHTDAVFALSKMKN